MTKFSIIIPAYKQSYFRECIDSILAQSYANFELIILNDNSPEDIESIVMSYNDSRIRYFQNESNVGAINVVDNWNKLLSYSLGEFVICMGDDDVLLRDCLLVYNELIDRFPKVDVFHGWTELIDEKSSFYMLQERRPEFESVYSMIWHRMNGRLQYIGDFCYRTNSLKSLGGFYKLPLAWASDDITSYMVAHENGVINSQQLLFQYRVNSQTISNTGGAELKLGAIKEESLWFTSFLSRTPIDVNDLKYHSLIIKSVDGFFLKKKIKLISSDMCKSPVKKLFYWAGKMKLYDLSMKLLVRSFLHSLFLSFNKAK